MSEIWTLPGPARFARTARDRLERGDSVLVGVPTAIDENEFADGLQRAIGAHFDVIDATDPQERPIPSVVAEQLDIELEPGKDAAVRLANNPALEGRYLAVAVTGKPDDIKPWTDFIRMLLAAARPIAITDRPRLLIVGGHGCATALAGTEPLAELWWWGVLDRLDTTLHVQRRLASRESDDLLRDAITEVAGYDLDLAGYLADEWDGDESSLPAQALRQRVWRAQIRCLMPLIDEERARLEDWVRTEVRGLPREKVLEPGDLFGLIQDNPRLKNWRGGHRKRLIYWLRDARNMLAHMTPLSPQEIDRGRRLIWQDRKLN